MADRYVAHKQLTYTLYTSIMTSCTTCLSTYARNRLVCGLQTVPFNFLLTPCTILITVFTIFLNTIIQRVRVYK